MEKEVGEVVGDMVRSRKPLSLSLSGLARMADGWRVCVSARFWQCDDRRRRRNKLSGAMRPTDRLPPPSSSSSSSYSPRSDLDSVAKRGRERERDGKDGTGPTRHRRTRTAGNDDENPSAFGDLEIIYVQFGGRKGARAALVLSIWVQAVEW